MKQSPVLKSVLGGAAIGLSCLMLQLAFSLFYWLPKRSVAVAARPSIDAVALVALILIASHYGKLRGPARKILLSLVPVVAGLCVLLGVAQGVALREFGYNFTLAYHMSKVQALLKMMYEAQSGPVFIITIGLLISAIALLILSVSWALARILEHAQKGPRARIHLALIVSAYALVANLLLGSNGSMTVELAAQVDEAVHREERIHSQAKKIEKEMKTVRRLQLGDELRRPTILVFVVESYGQILMEADKYEDFRSFLQEMQDSLTKGGYALRSKVYQAPVFGGSSWLANASILCRLMVPTEKTYFSLMETNTRCLPTPLNEAGYHSVFAASNTTEITEEYKQRFPFDTFLARDSFGYKGPRMSWSYMPDQFLIDVVERRILRQSSERPHFVYYKLTSSHHPWDTIPPFLPDWDEIGDGSIYEELAPIRFPDNAFLGGKHYNEGYEASVRYSLQTIESYLLQMPEERDVLAVVLGDHQPRRPVAVMDRDPWTIPLHLMSRDKDLIERFERHGFSEGLFVETPRGIVDGLELIASHIFRGLNDVTIIETKVYE